MFLPAIEEKLKQERDKKQKREENLLHLPEYEPPVEEPKEEIKMLHSLP